MASSVVFSRLTGAVRWSGGLTVLRAGDRWSSDDPLVLERPDLFTSDDPTLAPKSSSAVRPKRRCWTCRAEYQPTHPTQRYCGGSCRRERERTLTRAARRALAGERIDPKVPPTGATLAQLHRYRDELQGRIDELVMLANHLVGRPDPYDSDRRTTDEASVNVSDRPAFLQMVRAEIARLTQLREQATDRLAWAEANQDENRDLEVIVGVLGPGNPRQREWQRKVAAWEAQLGAADG